MATSLPFGAFVVLLVTQHVLATNSTEAVATNFTEALASNYTGALASNSNKESGNGCTLVVPQAVKKQMEPPGSPLVINLQFSNIRIRDVPSEGGSYGVEFRYICNILR